MQSQTTATRDTAAPAKIIRVAAFTGGKNIPGARFRVRQYIPLLNQAGIEIKEFFPRLNNWPPDRRILRLLWLAGVILESVPSVLESHRYDITFFQRELVSTLNTLEVFTKRPRIFDVDDAVWLNRKGRTGFAAILKMCDGVTAGNEFIAQHARQFNDNICLVPTAVDTDRYTPPPEGRIRPSRLVIGWSGLGSGLKYVYEVEQALVPVLNKHRNAVLRIVSDKQPAFKHLTASQFEYIPWSPLNEVEVIQDMTIGIMPVEDSLWARGKCSYKMLLYMACGVPVVVSPIGMNAEVLALGQVGIGPATPSAWTEALDFLLANASERDRMGRTGRKVVEQHYSLRMLAPRLASFLRAVAERRQS
jgi:glycosyltransferase involved in cell wall biosynthesis